MDYKIQFSKISNNKLGFTIVELIVVITILAILGTIGFISFSSHLMGTRDTSRLSQLEAIHSGLEVYQTNNDLPQPENYVEVRASGSVLGYQGYMGKNNLGMIQYSKGGKDPKDEQYFTYYLTADGKHFQLMAFLEDAGNKQLVNKGSNNSVIARYEAIQRTRNNVVNGLLRFDSQGQFLIPTTYAADYSKRYPTVLGKKLGILTESGTNSPIQEISSIVSSGYLDVALTTNTYIANFDDVFKLTGSGNILFGLEKNQFLGGKILSSCKNILDSNKSVQNNDGMYLINPDGKAIIIAYCDMTTDGGGWTKVGRHNRGFGLTYTDMINYPTSTGSQFTLLEIQARAIASNIKNVEFYYKHQFNSTTRCEGKIGPNDYSDLGAAQLTMTGNDYMCIDMDGNGSWHRNTEYAYQTNKYVVWGHCDGIHGVSYGYLGTSPYSGRNMCDGTSEVRSNPELADWTELYIR